MGGDIIQRLAGDVGLGLRDVAQRQGRVLTRMPSIAERRVQALADDSGNGGMGAALALLQDEQLQAPALEDAEIDEPLVLDASPAPGRRFVLERRGHGATLPPVRRDRQRPRTDTPGRRDRPAKSPPHPEET
jgi:hypothetical protein